MSTPSPDKIPPAKRPTAGFQIPVARNIVEFGLIIAWWLCVLWLVSQFETVGIWASLLVILGCWVKSVFFGTENMNQLYDAARSDLSHHRFLLLMAINMIQMILSFAFDFHLLYTIDRHSFLGIDSQAPFGVALFDFFYLSTLNFSFFGYSEILPQTVVAKIVNLTEIVLAFVTVIFLLSDFVSLKESLRKS